MSNRPFTCLVTGGSGYLGSELARNFRALGWRVIAASRSVQGPDSVKFSLGEPIPAGLFEGVDALVHGAYDFGPREWKGIHESNVVGSQRLLEAAKAAGVSIVTISSISAFPGCKSMYGKAKLLMEDATLAAGGTALRPGLIYGGADAGIYGRLKKQVRGKSLVPLLVGNPCALHLTYVDDLARVIAGVFTGTCPKQVAPWIVAHPEPWPMKKLLLAIAAAQGRTIHFLPVPWPLVLAGLKTFEALGIPLDFRSDNLISIVNQDPQLDFRAALACGVSVRPFRPAGD